MNKVYPNAKETLYDLTNGSSILMGGFGLTGVPENLIPSLTEELLKLLAFQMRRVLPILASADYSVKNKFRK
jgi:acyl CoA:acetate/3-ketoacid CoA transferase alpha subunit